MNYVPLHRARNDGRDERAVNESRRASVCLEPEVICLHPEPTAAITEQPPDYSGTHGTGITTRPGVLFIPVYS